MLLIDTLKKKLHPGLERRTCQVRLSERPACRVGFSDDGWSIAIHRARQACPSGLSEGPARQVHLFGGTCMSRPPSEECACHVRRLTSDRPFPFGGDWSPAPKAGLKPRAPWSAAIYRRFLMKALAFIALSFAVFCRNHESDPPVGAIHESPLPRIHRLALP